MVKPLKDMLVEVDEWTWEVGSRATDYPPDWYIAPHSHAKHQLIYAIKGLMIVASQSERWTVPTSRGIWMPCGQEHAIRCVGDVKMRSVFVRPDAAAGLPLQSKAISISPLLSELIKASVHFTGPFADDSREARIMRLILDEISVLPTLPLKLLQPRDQRLLTICSALQQRPDDPSTVADWGQYLGVDEKTIQRLFRKETGMTFGQWRQQARLMQALERIALGERIIDVAGTLGYDSPSAFASMFKRQFGTTPSQFFK
ncbi:helix-turn-helix transcriptional regulator [Pseudomonas putida]|uniref:Helix-turn-helix transcriptional regulator n=1 Tax=Pseudomonas putida TaxID=303 RepID=A0A7W2L0J6_PSEPU|nr:MULTISPECIES: helix-turn-helix transcriptional regulator [Pseudomonas]MBA6116267.1 helix-turn-helix transcriptional regulator [Pseudomonas putida]MBI6942779.1 helix-turn-helix transcriptional regulator [Pseudomonas putida]MBI6958826.1 helix-turn-helix transcriptional regulator [Pseudomonas putida]MCZ9639149.1 helix-turn-helix transcriptional regulator [Pseudomonas putida]MEC4874908.1 helix-turn-helix transcriptional regulator [Pseudomonas sp. NC26]